MRLPRHVTIKINAFLDQWLPPVVRDASWFLPPLMKVLFGKQAHHLLHFKQRGMKLSREEFIQAYREIDPVLYGYVNRLTDLNEASIPFIIDALRGGTVLEVGCGKGLLAERMSRTHQVTACDMQPADQWEARYPHIPFVQGWIEDLPFADQQFDTVVCTHTLEHVQDLFKAIQELRRVARQRLVIVVPKQRPYRYSFDLHLHFFPYPHSVLAVMGPGRINDCQEVAGDFLYVEERLGDYPDRVEGRP